MNYITRERVHVDRIATAWAIRQFVDADATFQFVPRTRDVRGMDGIPFDVRGAALTHRGGRCTFEVLLETHALDDPALRHMSRIIHSADLPQDEPSTGLGAGVLATIRPRLVSGQESGRVLRHWRLRSQVFTRGLETLFVGFKPLPVDDPVETSTGNLPGSIPER